MISYDRKARCQREARVKQRGDRPHGRPQPERPITMSLLTPGGIQFCETQKSPGVRRVKTVTGGKTHFSSMLMPKRLRSTCQLYVMSATGTVLMLGVSRRGSNTEAWNKDVSKSGRWLAPPGYARIP